MSDPIHSREQIETAWRIRLEAAGEAYRRAHRESGTLESLHKSTPQQGMANRLPDFESALVEARRREQLARDEYLRILKVFIDLVVHRKLPDEACE